MEYWKRKRSDERLTKFGGTSVAVAGGASSPALGLADKGLATYAQLQHTSTHSTNTLTSGASEPDMDDVSQSASGEVLRMDPGEDFDSESRADDSDDPDEVITLS